MVGLVTKLMASALKKNRIGAAPSTRANLLKSKPRAVRTNGAAVSSSVLSTVRAMTVGTATPLKGWTGVMMVILTIRALQMSRISVVNSMMVSLLPSSSKSVRSCGIAASSSAPNIVSLTMTMIPALRTKWLIAAGRTRTSPTICSTAIAPGLVAIFTSVMLIGTKRMKTDAQTKSITNAALNLIQSRKELSMTTA